MSWNTHVNTGNADYNKRYNTGTGATSLREHRAVKREQAEERNAQTRPERTKRYRTDEKFRAEVDVRLNNDGPWLNSDDEVSKDE